MPRTPGLRGRNPQRQGADRFAIRWAHEYLSVPAPSYPIDVSEGITDWGMLGNDTVGDCVPAAIAHETMLAGGTPTADQVVAGYLAYDKNQDDGVVIADYLLYLYQQKQIEGFAPVDLPTVDAVMGQTGRGVLLGVNLTDADQTAFSNGTPWTTAGTSGPDPNDGHGILKVKSASSGGPGTIVTWGADQVCEPDWLAACPDEAWAILTAQDMTEANYAQLVTDLDALPHATGPTPEPPAPEPTPPTPDPVPTPPTPEPPVPVDPPVPPTPDPTVDPLVAALAALEETHFESHALKHWAKLVTARILSAD